MRHDNKSKKNDVINGKQVANTMRRELRINVTNWEDQLFWMTLTAGSHGTVVVHLLLFVQL